jgi:hypothetical protein
MRYFFVGRQLKSHDAWAWKLLEVERRMKFLLTKR